MYNLQKERNSILSAFIKMGFIGVVSFFNVCKNLDAALSVYDLRAFYDGSIVEQKTVSRLQEILEVLRYE